ncbi:MAG: glycosyltransferase [Rhodothermaceae bacterium]|nr:glycosyltransferase [Rhodothermaceae bacterium]
MGSLPRLRRPRIALYSHDTCGLGHTRRNLRIAQALAAAPLCADVLMLTGARESSAFPIPPGVDMLSLPALYKEDDGHYRARSLSVDLNELIALRSGIIRSALETFEPDVFVVDNVPRGAMGELDDALIALQATATRCVLGLRDVLDAPETVAHEWKRRRTLGALDDFFDAVWVYGDPTVFAAADEYAFPHAVRAKLTYTGYLDPTAEPLFPLDDPAPLLDAVAPTDNLVLCAVGGGQDGDAVARAFASASWASEAMGLILTGPFMKPEARAALDQQAATRPDLRIARFSTAPGALYQQADCVVAMGGYNTILELLALGKHALIVPREQPRREQRIRAERLGALGLLDWLAPSDATPEALSAWLQSDHPPVRDARTCLDFGGLRRVIDLMTDLLPNTCAWPRRTLPLFPHATA